MNLDPKTVRLTLNALSHAGTTEFYNLVDDYRQKLPNLSYEMALTLAVYETLKSIDD